MWLTVSFGGYVGVGMPYRTETALPLCKSKHYSVGKYGYVLKIFTFQLR